MDLASAGLLAASGLIIALFVSWAGLKAWQGWLELKRFELSHIGGDRAVPPATGRIEIADLRERVRKLEAIAAGIDL
jgi:hypothetical protein